MYSTKYNDIAAYSDHQVARSLRAVLAHPGFNKVLSELKDMRKNINHKLFSSFISKFRKIKTIDGFQNIMFQLVKSDIKHTVDGLTFSGLDGISDKKGVLFISNHRSTSLDAAYVNYILKNQGRESAYVGAGDNIFTTEWLGHLIRLNKGFIVKRDVEEMDEKIREAERLSAYIRKLISSKKSVWIAQRAGRSKDGIDRTDSVLISMLFKALNYRNYQEWLEAEHLHAVSISWEVIPCDLLLARQMAGEMNTQDKFKDLKNIVYEIKAWKGRVHIAFCRRIYGEKRNEIVKRIDSEIQQKFRLWDANWLAFSKTSALTQEDKEYILAHIDLDRAELVLDRGKVLGKRARDFFYGIYANPVRMALKYRASIQDIL